MKDMLTVWKKRFELAKNWREPYDTKFNDFYKLYRFYLKEEEKNWKTKLFIPYIFTVIENIVPRMIINKPKVIIEPREEQDQDAASLMQVLVDYQWDQMDARLKLIDLVKTALIYGTAVAKVSWRFDSKMTLQKEPIITVGGWRIGNKVVRKPSILFDGPDFEVPDIKDIFVEPGAENIETANWIIQRTVTTIKALKDAGIYKDLDKVKKNDKLVLNEFVQDRDAVVSKDSNKEYEGDDEFNKIEVLECWTDDYVTTIANRQTIIRQELNPLPHGQKPFIRVVDRPVSKEFYGIGECEALEVLQNELNSIRNARGDNVKLNLNKVLMVARSAGVNYKNLKWKPGAIIPVNDVQQGIKPLENTDIAMSSFSEETVTKGDIQRVSGISEYTMGQGNTEGSLANNTASGIKALQEAGNQIIRAKILMLEEMGIRKIGKFMVAMNQFFPTEELTLRVAGEAGKKFQKVNPDELRGNFDLMVESGSTEPIDKDVKRNQKLTLFQLLMSNPSVSRWINTQDMIRRVVEVFDEKDIDKLMYSPEQIAEAEAEMQRSQMEDAMEGAGPGTPGEGMFPEEGGKPGQGSEKKPTGLAPEAQVASLQPPMPAHREQPRSNTQV